MKKTEPSEDKDVQRKELRRNQVFGTIIGVIGGLMSGNFWPVLPASLGWGGVILWGAVIGATLGSLGQFARAGKILTRSDNQLLNMAVALSVPLLFIALISLMCNGLSQ